jgi:hypothetical protein
MRVRSILVLALLGLLAVSATGCQQILKAVTPPALIKHVTVSAKVGTPDAQINGKLSPGRPSNLPLWDGSTVVHTQVVKSTLGTPDPYDDVVKGMATGLQKQGWQVSAETLPSSEASTTAFTVAASTGTGVVTISAQKNATTRIDYVIAISGK